MTRVLLTATIAVGLLVPARAQQTSLTSAHLRSAEKEVPRLIELLELKPGSVVADVGAGFGAWTMALAKAVGPSGRVYATEVGASQLAALRDLVRRESLANVVVVEGAADSTNLPPACCDAILVRDVYHHLSKPEEVARSAAAALKPGGRLAVVDFPPRPNSAVPSGVPANRNGHGVPAEIVEREVSAAGLRHVNTTVNWSPESEPAALFLVLFRKP